MTDCIFCKIVAGEAPSEIVADNDQIVAFKSIKPVADTHILIVPKKHIETFTDIDSENYMGMVTLAQQLITEIGVEDGYKLIFNGGKYQAVPHAHWHLLGGEMKGDGT